MRPCFRPLRLALIAALLVAGSAAILRAEPAVGIAMHGNPALGPGFRHFAYVNPDAPKGGRVTLGLMGTFDSLNPLIPKGVAPAGIREYVYESLLSRALDEPFSLYGLVARTLEVAEDRSWILFRLRPEARFSDGTPLTAADVIFSLELLRDHGQVFHRTYYKGVTKAEAVGTDGVRFSFGGGGNRELALLVGLMPILPRHAVTAETFERTTLDPPIGSGPYRVAQVEAGKTLTLVRNPGWWARDLPVTRGRFNFDEIRYEFARDATTLLELFRTGAIDYREEDSPERWSQAYEFPAAKDGRVVRRAVPLGTPAGMNALVLNTRRPALADPRVRRALGLLFDFEWINRNLFNGLYSRTDSFFSRSTLASTGRPADPLERVLLAPFSGAVRLDVLEGTWRPPATDGTGFNRANQRDASVLLKEAGYESRGGRMVQAKSGRALTLEALARSRAQEQIMLVYAEALRRLGITISIRLVDDTQYWQRLKTFDFDLIQWAYLASLSPGNEQLNRWSTEAAGAEGSLNFAGVRSPAADAMIQALLAAGTQEDFVAAARALDRVLLSGDYVVPLYHLKQQWIAHWSRIDGPATPTLYGVALDTWWARPDRT